MMAKRKLNKKRTEVIRADPKFKEILNEIKKNRVRMGKDNLLKPIPTSRLTLAMTRHPNFDKILKDLMRAELK